MSDKTRKRESPPADTPMGVRSPLDDPTEAGTTTTTITAITTTTTVTRTTTTNPAGPPSADASAKDTLRHRVSTRVSEWWNTPSSSNMTTSELAAAMSAGDVPSFGLWMEGERVKEREREEMRRKKEEAGKNEKK